MAKGMPANMAAQEKKWQAESDLRCLIDAEKIRKDKKRYAAAMKCLDEQKKALAEVEAESA